MVMVSLGYAIRTGAVFFARSLSLAFSGAWGWSLFFGCNYVCMHRIGLGLGLCTGFLT